MDVVIAKGKTTQLGVQ